MTASGGQVPGMGNRWNAGKDMSWEPIRAELVAEVAFDHMQGERFRHATHFVRWRPEREPRIVHLRPTRGGGPPRAGRRLRRLAAGPGPGREELTIVVGLSRRGPAPWGARTAEGLGRRSRRFLPIPF